MKKKMILVSFFIVILAVSLLPAGGIRGSGNFPWKMDRMLDLTVEQQAKMLDLRLQFQKEVTPLKTEIMKLRSEMKLELVAENFKKSNIEKMVGQMADLQAQIQLKKALMQRSVRDMLTEEQQKKYDIHLLSGPHKGHPGMGSGHDFPRWERFQEK